MQGMEWDLRVISKEFAELVEHEISKYLDWNATERSRGLYSILKTKAYSNLPGEMRGHQYGALTSVRIGIGKNHIRQVMEFVYSHESKRSWMSFSVDVGDAHSVIDFAHS